MKAKKVEIKKIFLLIIFIIGGMFVFSNESFAGANEYTEVIKDKSGIVDIAEQVDLEIQKDGKIYEYTSFVEEKVDTEKKIQKHTSEEKEVTSNSKEYLDKYFENTIDYEDENYKGQLQLIEYNIQTINNGYSERIDSKEIILSNMPTNDLSQVEKTKVINGREYILIKVNWESEENQEIDNTLVPKKYKGTAIYQCIIRTNNPNTYKVSANYVGEIEAKEQFSNYIITYKLKEKNNNFVIPITMIVGGILVLGAVIILLKPNAIIYNVQDTNKLVKVKSVKIRNRAIIDITNKINVISGNNFILQINNSSIDKLLNTTVVIKLNSQNNQLIITSQKNHFSF